MNAVPRIGSLFSGYGGLDLAVAQVLGGSVAWHCENDPAAARVLAHHWPDVPNLGDITAVSWDRVEPVDVLTGGFPCQDVSHAGRRAGLGPGTRTGLWSAMADAIDHLRPAMVIAENVRGLLSVRADSDVEPCPWCLGDAEGEPALRALGAVLADLADLGYDAVWYGLRAADVGAPHGRWRVFLAARPARDTDSLGLEGRAPAGLAREAGPAPRPAADADGDAVRQQPVAITRSVRAPVPRFAGRDAAADPGRDARPEDDPDRAAPGRGGRDVAAHADDAGRDGWPGAPGSGRRDEPANRCRRAVPDASGDRRDEGRTESEGIGWGPDAVERGADAAADTYLGGLGADQSELPAGESDPVRGVRWGVYGPAVRRWELILGRPAPAPTDLSEAYRRMVRRRRAGLDTRPVGMRGSLRPRYCLAPRFVEWLMGLPAGWVTAVPDISRNDQLRILGNDVVPRQATAAVPVLVELLGTGEVLP